MLAQQPKITHIRIIGQLKVNIRLLEIFSFFAETSERAALEELSDVVTNCFKEEALFKACCQADLNKNLTYQEKYLARLFLGNDEVMEQWFFPSIVQGLQYLVEEVKRTVEGEMPFADYARLVSIHFAFPARFEVWFAVPSKEANAWLATLSA